MSGEVEQAIEESKRRAWQHSRKGYIEGHLKADMGEWVDIVLSAPVSGITTWWEEGEVLRVRASFLTEVPVRS